jgi:hypothetical protein
MFDERHSCVGRSLPARDQQASASHGDGPGGCDRCKHPWQRLQVTRPEGNDQSPEVRKITRDAGQLAAAAAGKRAGSEGQVSTGEHPRQPGGAFGGGRI